MFLTEKSHTQNLLNKYSWRLAPVSNTNVLCLVDGKEWLEIVLKLKFIFQALGEEELSPFLPCVHTISPCWAIEAHLLWG